MRRGLILVVAAILGGCGPGTDAPQSDSRVESEGVAEKTEPTTVLAGDWERIPKAPIGWYRPEGLFWIDGRLVAVAGSTIQSWILGSREWEWIVSVPQADECEGCGYSETAVWTGQQLLLWGGGFSYLDADDRAHSGVAVELDGTIAPLPEAPIANRWWHDAVWTGTEMIVFGGGRDSHARRDGAAYNPETGIWRSLPPSPVGGYANTVVWTGEEMITWGGIKDSTTGTHGYPTGFIAQGAAYDPDSDRWREIEDSGLDARGWHSAVWTGEEMIIWGGVSEPQTECYDCGYASDAGAYDPLTGTWREIDVGPLSGRVEHTAVWTDSLMLVFGGGAPGGGLGRDDGAVFDPQRDEWSVLPEAPIGGRYRHASVWTGEEMIVWGGLDESSYSDGGSFRPDS